MPVQSPYIFLSHSTKDHAFTQSLAARLRENGFNVWVDVDSIPDGSTWLREIEKGVTGCAALVVVMSRPARESEWVERETLLAMDLGKPLFIVRTDTVPLPLHLINRQFTDFRQDADEGTRRLSAALHGALLKPAQPPPASLSPEPDEDNFFRYLEQLPGGEPQALVARDLYRWAKKSADTVTFSGKKTPGFHLRVRDVLVCSLWAYPRQPAVQVHLQYLSTVSPYTDREFRLSTLRSLNRLLSDPLLNEKADRRPTVPLTALNTAERLETFKQIMQEVFDNLRGE